jgi:hypothetical protein
VTTARTGEPPRPDTVVIHPKAQVQEGDREAIGDGGMGEIKHGGKA